LFRAYEAEQIDGGAIGSVAIEADGTNGGQPLEIGVDRVAVQSLPAPVVAR
jgi:hypothetical protein